MTTADYREATDTAVAEQTVKRIHHGDNDPDATRELLVDRAIRDRLFPPRPAPAAGRAMCDAWGEHRKVEEEAGS